MISVYLSHTAAKFPYYYEVSWVTKKKKHNKYYREIRCMWVIKLIWFGSQKYFTSEVRYNLTEVSVRIV